MRSIILGAFFATLALDCFWNGSVFGHRLIVLNKVLRFVLNIFWLVGLIARSCCFDSITNIHWGPNPILCNMKSTWPPQRSENNSRIRSIPSLFITNFRVSLDKPLDIEQRNLLVCHPWLFVTSSCRIYTHLSLLLRPRLLWLFRGGRHVLHLRLEAISQFNCLVSLLQHWVSLPIQQKLPHLHLVVCSWRLFLWRECLGVSEPMFLEVGSAQNPVLGTLQLLWGLRRLVQLPYRFHHSSCIDQQVQVQYNE